MLTEEESDAAEGQRRGKGTAQEKRSQCTEANPNSHHVGPEVRAEGGVYHRDGKHI